MLSNEPICLFFLSGINFLFDHTEKYFPHFFIRQDEMIQRIFISKTFFLGLIRKHLQIAGRKKQAPDGTLVGIQIVIDIL